jgi:peptidoglycan/LPS O-acetylase OafA/YrhL
MAHSGVFPLFAGADERTRLGWLLVKGWGSIVFGPAAVIGFFVISGFCIHLPYRGDQRLAVGRYYARRYIRILLPVFGFVIVYRLAGNRQPLIGADSILYRSVLWSLVCEEIYYAFYPGIRWLRKTVGWSVLLRVSFALSVATAAACFRAVDWPECNPFPSIIRFPVWPLVTALVLFPVWLFGCVLAEQSEKLPPLESSRTIWKWRFFAWAGNWVCFVLHFHSPLHLPQTLLWFGILAYFWIKREIAYGKAHVPAAVLISAGAWSYSLYLMHMPMIDIFAKLRLPNLGDTVNWLLLQIFVLGTAYVFYVLVERPSHRLARRAGSSRRQLAKAALETI